MESNNESNVSNEPVNLFNNFDNFQLTQVNTARKSTLSTTKVSYQPVAESSSESDYKSSDHNLEINAEEDSHSDYSLDSG